MTRVSSRDQAASARPPNDRVTTRAPLSIVIPTLNAADTLGPTLATLIGGVESGLVRELILSDGGSSDEIKMVADGLGARLIVGSPGRGAQLARGAAAANGDWLLFLHADTTLPARWVEIVSRHIETDPRAACFRLAFDENSLAARWVAGWANMRTSMFALPYGDQGLLISRGLYRRVGGYPPHPLMEDVAIARRLGRRRIAMLPETVVTSAERYRRDGWFRRGARNWWCMALYFAGVSPSRIAERYR